MKSSRYILCLSILLFAFSCSSKPPPPPPDQWRLDSITEKLDGWGDGRWDYWNVVYDSPEVWVSIVIDPRANDIAMNGYIDIVKEILNRYTPKHDAVIRLMLDNGEKTDVKKYGFINR